MGTITRNFANNIVTGGKVDGTDGLTGTIPASNVANDTLGNLTTFPATVGDFVEVTASDVPASPSTEGQLFYNSTSGTLKGISLSSGTWSSGGNAANAQSSGFGFGTLTAGVRAGGTQSPGIPQSFVEHYDGTSWTAATAMPEGRQDGGEGGTQTAGIIFGGESPAPTGTREYDGSAWTSGGTYPITARGQAGFGIQTAAVGAGGKVNPPYSNVSAEYDGSSWTAGNPINSSRTGANGTGPSTAGIIVCGSDGSTTSHVESYDGTSWTTETNYPVTLRQAATFGDSSTSAVTAGGVGNGPFGSASVNLTNSYDGSAWTAQGTLASNETHMSDAGGSTSAWVQGGVANYPTYTSSSQEWTGPAYAAKTLTTS